MAFIEQQQKQTPLVIDTEHAKELYKILLDNRRANTTPRYAKWAADISLIRKRFEQTHQQVKDVLQWYRLNISGQYTPLVFSSGTFLKQYPAILAAMQRQDEATPRSVVVTPEAEEIARGYALADWPTGTKVDQLGEMVQMTMDRWDALMGRCVACLSKHRRDCSPLANTINHVSAVVYRDREEFAVGWLTFVLDHPARSDNWKGDLKKWAWKAKYHAKVLRKAALGYCGVESKSDLVVAELLGNGAARES